MHCSNIVHEFVERVCVAALAIPSPKIFGNVQFNVIFSNTPYLIAGEMTSIEIQLYLCGHLSQGPQNGKNDLLSSEPQIHKPSNHYIPSSRLCVLCSYFHVVGNQTV